MFCRYCGVNIPNDSKFCPECGAKLIEQSQHEDTPIIADPDYNQNNVQGYAPVVINDQPLATDTNEPVNVYVDTTKAFLTQQVADDSADQPFRWAGFRKFFLIACFAISLAEVIFGTFNILTTPQYADTLWQGVLSGAIYAIGFGLLAFSRKKAGFYVICAAALLYIIISGVDLLVTTIIIGTIVICATLCVVYRHWHKLT